MTMHRKYGDNTTATFKNVEQERILHDHYIISYLANTGNSYCSQQIDQLLSWQLAS